MLLKKLFFSLVTLLFAFTLDSQDLSREIISSAGSSYSSGNLQLSWTLGEPMTNTFQNGNFILTQGFEQTILTITAIETPEYNENSIKFYPNPAGNKLTIDIEEKHRSTYKVKISNLQGRTIKSLSGLKAGEKHKIPVTDLTIGVYQLQLIKENSNSIHIFKLLKK